MKVERINVEPNEAQHPETTDTPQFTKLKLKKPTPKAKQEPTTVSLPKFQLKSRIKYITDWPPQEIKPNITLIGSVRQNGELSRNIKEAAKIKRKPIKIPKLPDLEKVELEKPEEFDFRTDRSESITQISESPSYDENQTNESKPEFEDNKVRFDDKPTIFEEKPTKKKEKVRKHEEVPKEVKPTVVEEKITRKEETSPVDEEIPIEKEEYTTEDKNKEEKPKQHEEKVIADEEKPLKKKPKPTRKEVDVVKEKEKLLTDDQLIPEKDKSPEEQKLPVAEKQVEEEKLKEDKPTEDKKPIKVEHKEKPKQEKEIISTLEEKTEHKKEKSKKQEPMKKKDKSKKMDTKPSSTEPTQQMELKPESLNKVETDKIEEPIELEKPTEEIPKPIETDNNQEATEPIEDVRMPTEKLKKVKKLKTSQQKELVPKSDEPKEEELPKLVDAPEVNEKPEDAEETPAKPKLKLTPIKIIRKEVDLSKAQHAESVQEPQFTKPKLRKISVKPKEDTSEVKLPKFQLKSRIKFVNDWPPNLLKPLVTFIGSVRQNGILSRNIKEASKIKKKVYKEPKLPDIEKTNLEKPQFGYEDIIEAQKQVELEKSEITDTKSKEEEPDQFTTKLSKQSLNKPEEPKQTDFKKLEDEEVEQIDEEPEQLTPKRRKPSIKKSDEENQLDFEKPVDTDEKPVEDLPEQFTIKPRKQSLKKTDEIVDEITIKKKLKPVRKASINLPEITEPETVTFRPKTTKTKEDVEQEFNIHLDSYAEEEISMSSKVKLKPQRQPTFNEEADETSIKFYQENEYDGAPEVVEIIESDDEAVDKAAKVSIPLKKTIPVDQQPNEEIESELTISRPKPKEEVDMSQEISLKLTRKPKYTVDTQEEVSFELKPKIDKQPQEEITSSTEIKLKPKKKYMISEADDEAEIKIVKEVEDDTQVEEVVISDAESEENVQMVIKRKPKKPTYEVSEVEELSIELKPKKSISDETYEEELTISTKRKPKKPEIQGILDIGSITKIIFI